MGMMSWYVHLRYGLAARRARKRLGVGYGDIIFAISTYGNYKKINLNTCTKEELEIYIDGAKRFAWWDLMH